MRALALAVLALLVGAAALVVAGERDGRGTTAPDAGAASTPAGTEAPASRRVPCRLGAEFCAPREQLVARLAARLSADPAVRLDAGPLPARAKRRGTASGRDLQRRTCAVTQWRTECKTAVASRAVRELFRSVRRSPDLLRKADVLLGVGRGLGMTASAVVNTVRAELDARLTREVERGGLRSRARLRALTCYDELRVCNAAALRRR